MINKEATRGVVYRIRIVGDRRRYIGSAANFAKRLYAHRWMLRSGRHHCAALRQAVAKAGFDKVRFEIVENVDGLYLVDREQYWMNHYAIRLFNVCLSSLGPAGNKKTPEQAEKSARHHRGKIVTAETKARLRAAMLGNTNGHHQAKERCGKGHLMAGDNLYFYKTKGKTRRCCRSCQQENNAKQHARRYPKGDENALCDF